MRKVIAIIAILAFAVMSLTAEKPTVQFAQQIKIDTSMTEKTLGLTDEAKSRWIDERSTKISKETYDIILQAMKNADKNGELYYFQYIPEYGEYNQILHKEVYGGDLSGNGKVYITISYSLNGTEWFYSLEYRIQLYHGEKERMIGSWSNLYMKDLFVKSWDGNDEQKAIKALYNAVYDNEMWGAYNFVEEVYNKCLELDTTGLYRE